LQKCLRFNLSFASSGLPLAADLACCAFHSSQSWKQTFCKFSSPAKHRFRCDRRWSKQSTHGIADAVEALQPHTVVNFKCERDCYEKHCCVELSEKKFSSIRSFTFAMWWTKFSMIRRSLSWHDWQTAACGNVLLTGNLRSLLVSVRRVVQYPTVNPEGTMPQHIANLVYHSNAKKSWKSASFICPRYMLMIGIPCENKRKQKEKCAVP